MNKLKTLGEIGQCSTCDLEGYRDNGSCCDTKQLRQEAINWLKALDDYTYNESLDDFADSGYDDYTSTKYGAVQCWIIHFFGITEEELK